ncbi:Response regulator [Sulfidibacter corallicola]|uniref:Response regulator n=1 Tax=Sulfidibacter corallicola TaxID=2818388 RepID=A0A8A4TRE5_SULCO|nr:HD domain-containing phosphohydrolase [Sulfidibacter corallicola]QTD51754.1 response regulator [Sulfidibacter corallicola]
MTLKKQRVLITDDEPNNLQLMRQILRDDYHISTATDGPMALEVASKVVPDIILLDVMMPGMDGYEVCTRLKANPETARIPVIFVSARAEIEDEDRGFQVGAVDYITKPVSRPIVLARTATHLALYDQQRACEERVVRKTAELACSQSAAIHMLGEAGHYNDTDTGVHIWRMAAYSGAIARRAGWHVDRAAMLALAAPMHDTGKIGIPDAILKKPARLDAEEWVVMKTHTTIGHSILSKSDTPLFRMAADVALSHHEKWNGEGYPAGLSGVDIPESARIVAIADVFDALTMVRPYKKAWPIDAALAELERGSGNHFEPRLVACFMEIESEIMEIKAKWDRREQAEL